MARFISIGDLEFVIVALRWSHNPDLVGARDQAEHLLRSMPRDRLSALHAGLNESSSDARAMGDARILCEQAAALFRQGQPDAECLLWLETGAAARRVNIRNHEGNDD